VAKRTLRLACVPFVGAALLLSAAPISLFAVWPQAKSPAPSKRSSQAPAQKSPAKSSKKRRSRPRAQTAPTPERIREIQSALARHGYYQGDPTGKWDAKSAAAMRNFQQASGLTPTGKFDALSLQKLGLGSPTAGAAPPRATVNGARPPQSPPR